MSPRRQPERRTHLDDFTGTYVAAALWSSTDAADEQEGEPLDANYGPGDIAPPTMRAMQRDCATFVERYGKLIEDDDSPAIEKWGRWPKAGHDFWLSRNAHGAGFFDGDWPQHGDELQEAAESYGTFELYVGDDGLIYGAGAESDPPGAANEARRLPPPGATEHRDARTGQFAAGPDPVGEWGVVQRMMKVYAQKAGLGAYVHNSAIPTGRPGEWRFWAQKPGERSKEHQVSTQHLKNAYERGGLSEVDERDPRTGRFVPDRHGHGHHRRMPPRRLAPQRRGASVRDYDVTDNRGKRLAGPFKDYGTARSEADSRGGVVGFVAGELRAKTRWSDAEILSSVKHGDMMTQPAKERAYELVEAGLIDAAGTWKLTPAGERVLTNSGWENSADNPHRTKKVGCPVHGAVAAETSRRTPRKHTAARRSPDTWKTAGAGAMAIAAELSRRVGGTGPKAIPDGFRWSDKNESASFTTYSPQHSQKVVVVVSVFEKDGTLALNFFSDESLSATAQYENIGHNLYSTVDFGEMVADLKWVWETVDEYAESWGAGHDEVDEASRVSRVSERRPTRPTRRNPVNASRHPRAGVRAVHPRHQHSVLSRHGSKMIAAEARGQRRAREGVDAEEAGERYAEEQLQSDHFNQWVYGQMVEGRRMRRADPKSVIPLENAADYKRLARNILQQLGWDMDRDMDMRAILDVVGVESEGSSQDSAVARDFAKGVRAVLLKPSTINSLASDLRRVETELKRGERGAKESRAPRLLPPAPRDRS